MEKQPVLAIEVDGTRFHEDGSKQAEQDEKEVPSLELASPKGGLSSWWYSWNTHLYHSQFYDTPSAQNVKQRP